MGYPKIDNEYIQILSNCCYIFYYDVYGMYIQGDTDFIFIKKDK